jgi:CheY-like chemotaxis protein
MAKKNRLNILIIDDELLFIQQLKHELEKNIDTFNVNVIYAHHIRDVNDEQLKKINIAVIDLKMPELNGIDTCMILRNKINAPLMILTSEPDDERLKKFGAILSPIMPLGKSDNFPGLVNSILGYYQIARDNVGMKKKLNDQDVNAYAVGFLMSRLGLTDIESKDAIKKYSRNNRMAISLVSEQLLSLTLNVNDLMVNP